MGTITESSRIDVLMQVANTGSNYIDNVKLRVDKNFVYSRSLYCSACYTTNAFTYRQLNSVGDSNE